jgi:catechol 2,3-dioxygenase-like lactoylglutathione lyase family enzyme
MMTNTLPHRSSADAHFSFTKLLVGDLAKTAAFYKAVCGLVELQRVEASIEGRAIREITFLPTCPGGGSLTLLQFLDATKPQRAELILGFTTSDIEAFVDRARAAGGRVTDPIRAMPEHHLRVAFVEDVEGHLIEVVQLDSA